VPSTIVCDVWLADIGLERPAHRALLNEIEQQRRARYRQDADRTRFTVAAALLRLVASAQTGIAATSVHIDRTCPGCAEPHGKPRIVGTGLHASISHSGDRVALAVSRAAPVGVDVESITRRDVVDLAPTVLAAAEPLSGTEDFYTYWCRKEAVVKATGDGLRVPLRQVVVSPADTPARLISYQDGTLAATMRDLPIEDGYRAALAVLAEGDLEVRIHDATELLLGAGR
jgi:4'-phosphopantetheinyl transferase